MATSSRRTRARRGSRPRARRAAAARSGSSPASPTAGTAARPGARRPAPGAPTSTVIPRATACGDANAAVTSLIGPNGMSAASSASIHSAVVRPANRDARIGRRSSRWTTRSPLVAYRGSSASPGNPMASHRRGHCRSLPTATASSPSAVAEGLVRHQVGVGVAHPDRRRAAHERVLRLVDEDGERRLEERHVDPLPADVRPRRRVAGEQAGQDRDRAEQPGDDVADRHADLGRPSPVLVGRPRDRHQPADRLDHEVVARLRRIGAVGAEPRDREVDEVRVELAAARRRRTPARPSRRRGSSRRGRRTRARSRRSTSRPASVLRSSRIERLFRLTARK